MSSLIVSHDLHIMMLELAVEKLFVRRKNIFDEAILKKTTVLFRMLDDEWTALYPQRSDYHQYRGSNYESEPFHGGKSILFSLPEASLENSMKNIDLQMHITKEVSHYFEGQTSEDIGYAIVNVDNLFNGIINELKDRKEFGSFLHYHEREPISRSVKGVFSILGENSEDNGSHIEVYVRLSYFGKSIITEILREKKIVDCFYAQEETNEKYPYLCRELGANDIANNWNSVATIPPEEPQSLQCDCQSQRRVKSIQESTQQHMSNLIENNEVNFETMNRQTSEEEKSNENLRPATNDSDISTKENKRKVKKKKQSAREAEATKENKSPKNNKAKKSTKTEKINSGQKNEESTKKGKTNEKGETLLNQKSNKNEESKKNNIREEENLEKERKEVTEKREKIEKERKEPTEKRETIEKERKEFTEKREKIEKENNKESRKANKENKENKESKEKLENDEKKIGNKNVKHKENGEKEKKRRSRENKETSDKKEAIDRKENRANFDSKGRGKLNQEKIEKDRRKMTRRENAGPITVGIWEKKNPSCLEISPQCSCEIVDNSQIYNSLSCGIVNSFVDCHPERRNCRNNPIFPSCYSEIFF